MASGHQAMSCRLEDAIWLVHHMHPLPKIAHLLFMAKVRGLRSTLPPPPPPPPPTPPPSPINCHQSCQFHNVLHSLAWFVAHNSTFHHSNWTNLWPMIMCSTFKIMIAGLEWWSGIVECEGERSLTAHAVSMRVTVESCFLLRSNSLIVM